MNNNINIMPTSSNGLVLGDNTGAVTLPYVVDKNYFTTSKLEIKNRPSVTISGTSVKIDTEIGVYIENKSLADLLKDALGERQFIGNITIHIEEADERIKITNTFEKAESEDK